jgi:modulator of FtsH protease
MGPAFNPPDWSTFFSAEAGASAALTGLIFVAISINLRRILKMRQLVARSAKALFLLMGILLASTACMAPGQTIRVLGCELATLGALVWILTTVTQHKANHNNPYVKMHQLILQVVLAQFAAIPLIAGGVSLMLGFGGGLYWLVAGTVFSFIAALIDAWVLLIEILR